MSKKKIALAATFACLILPTPFVINSLSRPESASPLIDTDTNAGAELISGYRQWTKVNPEPAFVHSRVAIQCAAPTAAQVEDERQSPHLNKFITVYVNDTGRHAMMKEEKPRYPQGSVIVKEKLLTKESTAPELLTVMVKREPGYNAVSGDWEYMVLDGAGKSVKARGKLEKCQACHVSESYSDYVARTYLPDAVRTKLK